MSTETTVKPSVFRQLRAPQALNYLIMTGAGLAVYAFIMMARGNDAGALIAILLAVAGILARWTAAPVLILLLTTYLMFDPGFMNLLGFLAGSPWFGPRNPGGFNVEDAVLAASLLAYTIGHFRLTSLLHKGMPDEPTISKERTPIQPAPAAGGTCRTRGIQWTLFVARRLRRRRAAGMDDPGV